MSLNNIMNRKKRKPMQEANNGHDETTDERPGGAAPLPSGVEPPTVGTEAMIPESSLAKIGSVIKSMQETGRARPFSMNEILSMDSEAKTIGDVLSIPVGGGEKDMYRMLERTRISKHEKYLYCEAIRIAEHGIGYKRGNLDFPVPMLGEHLVKLMRASVSIDGASLEIFERTTSTWVKQLYQTQQDNELRAKRGITQ